MSNIAQRKHFGTLLNDGSQRQALDAIHKLGKALPCSVVSVVGAIVTVKFEVSSGFTLPHVTMPLAGAEYIRYPIKAGDKGVCIPMDCVIGNMSGLGENAPSDLSTPANLSALVFVPISNTAWSAVDPNALTLYAPNGVMIRDTANNSHVIVTPTGVTIIGKDSVSISSGGSSISMLTNGTITISGSATISIVGGSSVALSDAANSTNLTQIKTVFNSLLTWLNSHAHATNGAAPSTPYSGGNIIT